MLSKTVERRGSDWDVYLPYVLFAYRTSMQESTRESPFFLMYGRDARLPTVLSMEAAEQLVHSDVDSYKGELVSGLAEAWKEAQTHVKKAQQAQKKFHDRHAREAVFYPGDRVFVYMPQEKLGKAYKFARPFHGPYRVKEVFDNGVEVCPVNRPDDTGIRVALNRIRACPDSIPSHQVWPATEKRGRGRPKKKANDPPDRDSQVNDSIEGVKEPCVSIPAEKFTDNSESLWTGRLRKRKN